MAHMMSISVSAGDLAGEKHNCNPRYRQGLENIDADRTKYNEVLVNENLDKFYESLFGEAVEKYNEKQKRSDRKIGNYLTKIEGSKQEKVGYELVVQIGNLDTNSAEEEANRIGSSLIYRQWLARFEKEFPNFQVFQAAIHQDEATPHLHVAYVPVSTGNKRGLETKNSLRGAMREMGYTDVREVSARMRDLLEEVAKEHGIERLDMGCKRAHLSVRDWIAHLTEIEQSGQELPSQYRELFRDMFQYCQEAEEITNDAVAYIDNIVRKTDQARFGNYQETIKEIGQEAKEASEALHPRINGLRSILGSIRGVISQFAQKIIDNVIHPLTERYRRSHEYAEPEKSDVGGAADLAAEKSVAEEIVKSQQTRNDRPGREWSKSR